MILDFYLHCHPSRDGGRVEICQAAGRIFVISRAGRKWKLLVYREDQSLDEFPEGDAHLCAHRWVAVQVAEAIANTEPWDTPPRNRRRK